MNTNTNECENVNSNSQPATESAATDALLAAKVKAAQSEAAIHLGLPADASPEEILERFRSLNGDDTLQSILDHVREMPLDHENGEPGGSNVDSQPDAGGSRVGPARAQGDPDPAPAGPGSPQRPPPPPAPQAPSVPPAPPNLTRTMTQVIHGLHEHSKPQPQSPIDFLSRENQRIILALLDDFDAESVAETLALPEPYGWGFQTSKSSLNRFRKRHHRREQAEQTHQTALQALEFLRAQPGDPAAVTQATLQHLRVRLYEITSSSDCTLNVLAGAAKILNDIRKADLLERKLDQQNSQPNEPQTPPLPDPNATAASTETPKP